MRKPRRSQAGFTLMELMVVIVIVAILAAVAVPLYINYVKDAQRTEAKGAIGAIIAGQQVYYQNPNTDAPGNYLTAGDNDEIKDVLRVDLTESLVNWDFLISENGDATDGFKVVATGKTGSPAKGLVVTYEHSRTTGGTWSDETAPVEGGGGGGGGTP